MVRSEVNFGLVLEVITKSLVGNFELLDGSFLVQHDLLYCCKQIVITNSDVQQHVHQPALSSKVVQSST